MPTLKLSRLMRSPGQLLSRSDCIVLDAPCSAIGVIRRHPDIRLLRHSTDIPQTVQLQKQILENMWQQLKVGGTLLYITCSILKAENEQQMVEFFTTPCRCQRNQDRSRLGHRADSWSSVVAESRSRRRFLLLPYRKNCISHVFKMKGSASCLFYTS